MNRALSVLVSAACVLAGTSHAISSAPPADSGTTSPSSLRPFVRVGGTPGTAVVRIDLNEWLLAASRTGTVSLDGFPLPDGRVIDLELEQFTVATPETRFVLGRSGGADAALDFDPASVTMFRGSAAGFPASRVFLSIARGSSVARIDLGPGEGRFLLSDRAGGGVRLREGELAVYTAGPDAATGLPVALCGAAMDGLSPGDLPPGPADPVSPRGLIQLRGIRQLELAVDTDNEFFVLFPSAEAAATYIVQLYGIVSDIYIRDVSTRIHLTFVRLWDTPNDPYNVNDLLTRLAAIFNSMPSVPRDAVQLLSGRVNINPAGQAFLSALCTPNGVSWCCYILGFFVDPEHPTWTNRDIYLAAHELGHNCGTGHTDQYGLDNCGTGAPPARRGSIMSYCGQGYSGSDANYDLWFHEHTANLMRQHIFSRTCVGFDCNGNGVVDNLDIQGGSSPDANANGVPDECEDCNANTVLDPLDISSGTSADVNANLIPDECEADCNGNSLPDATETIASPAIDLNRNRVPDSCEGDCDGDGAADYNEIQGDMSLDINRDTVLDSCQRCIPGGPTDLAALDHAWNVYAGSVSIPGILEFFAGTGVRTAHTGAADLPNTSDLIITPDRRILVSTGSQNRVARFTPGGAHEGTFIAGGAGSGGLSDPAGMLLTPAGTLLVASRGSHAVLEFDAQTGVFIRPFVQPGAGGLTAPHGLAFGPVGNLFVTSASSQVFEYSGTDGAFIRIFVTAAASGGLLDPRGLIFKPDGNLLVCSRGNDQVIQYDGASGAPLGRWNQNGVPGTLWLDQPWCIRRGPNGNIFVSRSEAHRSGDGIGDLHVSDVRVFEFDVATGRFEQAYIMGDDTGLSAPSGFDFMPGDATDCNRNQLPDTCDIAQGASRDRNGNGRPDECDCLADWSGDGAVNSSDVSAFLTAWLASLTGGTLNGDFDDDGSVNSADISAFLTAWIAALTGGC